MSVKKPEILKLSDYQDAILRNRTETVSFPLSEEDRHLIANMKHSIQTKQLKKAKAPYETAAGMAANQWGIRKRIFLFCPDGHPDENLEVVINPRYEPLSDSITQSFLQSEEWEACFSIPYATGRVMRYNHIRVSYQNENGVQLVKELHDWYARVWQHENDHLDGFLYDDPRTGKCLEKLEFSSPEELDQFYSKIRAERQKPQEAR